MVPRRIWDKVQCVSDSGGCVPGITELKGTAVANSALYSFLPFANTAPSCHSVTAKVPAMTIHGGTRTHLRADLHFRAVR